jgi:inward rectifier potassium channel
VSWRLLNRDGTFNVERKEIPGEIRSDLYHWFLTIPWSGLFAAILGVYLAINLIFACLYVACGPEGLAGSNWLDPGISFLARFQDAYFFSVQTFATIGYGKLVPNGMMANLLVTLEALIGLMGFAMATGLVFARFSRPTARVVFSDVAVINHHDKVPSFMFRMANLRANQIVESRVRVTLSQEETTAEGESYRTFYDMKLERASSPMFVMTWLVVHPIDEESPLYGLGLEDLKKAEAEIMVSMTGIDESFAQSIHARFSYTPEEILWDRNFADMITEQPGSDVVLVDMAKISQLEILK